MNTYLILTDPNFLEMICLIRDINDKNKNLIILNK
jgi:hypothetical protein